MRTSAPKTWYVASAAGIETIPNLDFLPDSARSFRKIIKHLCKTTIPAALERFAETIRTDLSAEAAVSSAAGSGAIISPALLACFHRFVHQT